MVFFFAPLTASASHIENLVACREVQRGKWTRSTWMQAVSTAVNKEH